MSDYTGKYVVGFVLPVDASRLDDYRGISEQMARLWKEHGALEYVECIADDVQPGKLMSFPQSVMLKRGEVVWFSYIVYKSRRHRDRVMAKVMSDPRLAEMMHGKAMPFDGKRMFWGGFKVMVRA